MEYKNAGNPEEKYWLREFLCADDFSKNISKCTLSTWGVFEKRRMARNLSGGGSERKIGDWRLVGGLLTCYHVFLLLLISHVMFWGELKVSVPECGSCLFTRSKIAWSAKARTFLANALESPWGVFKVMHLVTRQLKPQKISAESPQAELPICPSKSDREWTAVEELLTEFLGKVLLTRMAQPSSFQSWGLQKGTVSGAWRGCDKVCVAETAVEPEGPVWGLADEGSFTHFSQRGLFSPWSNCITSLFSSYRKSQWVPSHRNSLWSKVNSCSSSVLEADSVQRKSQFTVSFSWAWEAESESAGWAGGQWAAFRVHKWPRCWGHTLLSFSFFLKKHYLNPIFSSDSLPGLTA